MNKSYYIIFILPNLTPIISMEKYCLKPCLLVQEKFYLHGPKQPFYEHFDRHLLLTRDMLSTIQYCIPEDLFSLYV